MLGVYECGPFSKLPPPGVLSENEGDCEVGGRVMELSRVGPLSRLKERQRRGENQKQKLESCIRTSDVSYSDVFSVTRLFFFSQASLLLIGRGAGGRGLAALG